MSSAVLRTGGRWAAAALLVLAGALSADAATLLAHAYELQGSSGHPASLADVFGGPSLQSDGGTLVPGLGYQFNQGGTVDHGLVLTNALDPRLQTSNDPTFGWSIEMRFEFDVVGGYRKIIDSHARAQDVGLYDLSGSLIDYPLGSSGTVLSPRTFVDLVVTRDLAGDENVYANGSSTPVYPTYDPGPPIVIQGNYGAFTNSTSDPTFLNEIHFFEDDVYLGSGEVSPGTVTRILIFSGVLSGTDVQTLYQNGPALPGSAPEPASLALALAGALALARRRGRRR
jgi:hypothetical protein